jgi:Zn-finger nucleic acid-binding protein
MNCPHCNVPLQMTDRQGVEVDYCPRCRGVWLDRGELDKLIERSSQWEQRGAPAGSAPAPYRRDDDDDDDYYRRHGRHRKRGLLGDIFDFD